MKVTKGLTEEWFFGDYSDTNPEINYTFDNTGTYSIYLYLQDETTETALTLTSGKINFDVINGIDSQTCNIPVYFIANPELNGIAEPTTTTDPINGNVVYNADNPDDVLEILLGGSEMLGMLIGLGIVLGLMFTAGSYSTNPFLLGFTAIISLIIVTVLGLIPAFILILILVVSVLFMVGSAIIGKRGD